MTDYSNWKVLKSVINYTGDDEEKQKAAQAAQEEYTAVAEWCNETGRYSIEEDETYYMTEELPEPEPHVPTYEEVRQMRIRYRREHIDDQTAERTRKQANGTWTADDEAAYLALDAEVTAYIEEHFPYPAEE
jgi:hypothetical protein